MAKATPYKSGSKSKLVRGRDVGLFDQVLISEWEDKANESSTLLKNYITRRENNEWMSEDEVSEYRSALEKYKSSTSSLYDLQRKTGNYDEESGKKYEEYISTLSTDIDSAKEVFGTYKTPQMFEGYLKQQEENGKLAQVDLVALGQELEELRANNAQLEDHKSQHASVGSLFSQFTDSRTDKLSLDYGSYLSPKTQQKLDWLRANGLDMDSETYNAIYDELNAHIGRLTPLIEAGNAGNYEQRIHDAETQYNKAKAVQDPLRVGGYLDGVTDPTSANYDAEYAAYVQKGASIENPSYAESRAPIVVAGWKPLGDGEEVNNPVTFSLDNKDKFANGAAKGAGANALGMDAIVLEMTDEQIDNYNYIIAKYGKADADVYLEMVRNEIKGDVAQEFYKTHLEDKWLGEIMFSAVQGVDQFMSGMSAISGNDYTDKRLFDPQLIGAYANADLADNSFNMWYNFKEGKWEDTILGKSAGQIAYDFGTTSANMAPSIAAGMLANTIAPGSGGYVTNTLMGLSSGGNAYKDALNRGYDEGQARLYGTLVGTSEVLLSKVLSSTATLGDSVTGKFLSKAINGIDSGFARFALDFGGRAFSEGLEEGLQEILNPFFENVALGTDNTWEDINWEQVAYSYLLGSMSFGLGTEGISTVANHAKYNSAIKAEGNKIVNNGGVESLVALANEMAGVGGENGAVLSKRIGKVNGKNGVNTKAVGRLSATIEGINSARNKADISKALVLQGLTEKQASAVAEHIVNDTDINKMPLGVRKLMDSEAVKNVRQMMTDGNSAVASRNFRYNSARQGIRVDENGVANADDVKAYLNKNQAQATGGFSSEAKTDLSVSEDGKAYVTINDDTVEVTSKAFVDGEDGKLKFKVNGDQIVDTDDVTYSDVGEAYVVSAITDIGLDSTVAQAVLDEYKGTNAKQGSVFANNLKLAYKYGRYAQGKSNLGKILSVSPAVANRLYDIGNERSKAEAEKAQADLDSKRGKHSNVKGEVIYEGELADENGKLAIDENTLTDVQRASLHGIETIAKLSSLRFHIVRSTSKDGTWEWVQSNGKATDANGMYIVGTNDIYIDLNAGEFGEGTMLYTVGHEVMHFIKDYSPKQWKAIADFLMEEYAKNGHDVSELFQNQIDLIKAHGEDKGLTEQELEDKAYEEIVSDAMSKMFVDGSIVEVAAKLRKKNKGLWETFKKAVMDLLDRWGIVIDAYKDFTPNVKEAQWLDSMESSYKKLQKMVGEAFLDASETYSQVGNLVLDEVYTDATEVSTDAVAVEETTKHSYRSLAQAAGFEAREVDGIRGYYRNGQKVTEVTVDDIEISPIGAMINYSLDKGDISKEDAKKQKEMFAKICTLACKTNDFSMAMQFVGSAVFTGMKANADKQYGTTYDFPSICTKTQAVIDAMSKKMVTLKRGLSNEEILDLYQEVFASGNPVPCPECYVFSRWIGIGGLLDNIYEYQTHYGKMSVADASKAYAELHKKVAKYASENGISFGKAKGALAKTITDKWAKLTEKIEKADNQGEKVKDSDRALQKSLENEMVTVKALSWLDKVYFVENPLDANGNPKSNPKVNKNFTVPADVLFDLNKGDEFASKYSEAWGFRTTQGAGYGKAITPYAEAVLGEGILATNNTSKTIKDKAKEGLKNPFLEQRGMMDKDAKKALDRARLKQKIQAFLGGQRFQSTSDARYENASDYLLAALEMQAMHGRVQVYTKVDGAVPAFGAWGFSINQSLMPLGGGLNAKGDIIDTKVGGMNPSVAFKNRENHETAGTITIGVNDNHIRKMFTEIVRDFIIPYHASGGKAWLVNAFRMAQDKAAKKDTFVRSTDYSRTQGDKVLSDTVLKWQGKTDAEIAQIHAVREARLAILTGGKPNMDVVRGNRFLSALHDKFAKGGEWEGVKIAKSKVESQIFPNEFWDETVTYEESGKITQDYLDYCDDLGFLHRFSGTVPSNGVLIPVNGYNERGERVQLTDLAYKYDANGNKTNEIEPFFWKVLTDRRMYGNDGHYLAQKIVTLNDTTESTVTSFAKKNDGRQYDKLLSMETADKIAGVKKSARQKNGLETYTEAQYNTFGWASYNGVITANERETLFSRYADFKHNRNKYPVTRWGEAVIHSTECPDVIMYVKGSIKVPEITRIVRITADDIFDVETIQREVVLYEQEHISQPYEAVEFIYGEEIFREYKKRDFVSFQEYFSREEGKGSGTSVSDSKELQDGERSRRSSVKGNQADDGKIKKSSRRDYAKIDSKAVMTADRIDDLIEDSGAGRRVDYANSWITSISPTDFLNMTTTTKIQDRAVFDKFPSEWNDDATMDTYDYLGELKKNGQTPYLAININTGEVVGHEGRHRLRALEREGITSVEIMVEFKDDEYRIVKYSPDGKRLQIKDAVEIINQFGTGQTATIKNVIPLNEDYRDTILANYGEATSTSDNDIRYSHRQKAPTFYSYMGVVIDGVKQDKLGASSVVNMLKGKGVKDEEIKWSGIEAWLDGKKSVSKAELQEFIAGSQLQIEESVLGRYGERVKVKVKKLSEDSVGVYVNGELTETFTKDWGKNGQYILLPDSKPNDSGDFYFSEDDVQKQYEEKYSKKTKWSKYKLDGGKNYREVVFKMPGAEYTNNAMQGHWGDDAQGILAHARLQDFKINGGKMLFVEEIQSDWHNEGSKVGYATGAKTDADIRNESANAYREFYNSDVMQSIESRLEKAGYGNAPTLFARLIDGDTSVIATLNENSVYLTQDEQAFIKKAIDEEAKRKAELEKAPSGKQKSQRVPDAPFKDTYHEYVLKCLIRNAAENGYDSIGWTTAQIQSERWSDEYAEGYRIEYDQDIPKFLRKYGKKWGADVGKTTVKGNEVWSMPITDSMKDSVLYEGQVMYQHRGSGMTSRGLLVNALESATINEDEVRRLAEYKEKIDLINAEEQKLQEIRAELYDLSFAPKDDDAKRDNKAIRELSDEANKIANRINIYDRQLLKLEATAPLKALLEREKEKARKSEKQKNKASMERYRDNRHKTVVRNQIKRVAKDLDKLLNRGTKERNVKNDMQETVGSVLKLASVIFNDEITNEDIVLMGAETATDEEQILLAQYVDFMQKRDSSTFDEAVKYIDKIARLNSKLADLFMRERARLNRVKVSSAIDELGKAYAKLANSKDGYVNFAYNEETAKQIASLSEDLGGTIARDMTLDQLEEVYKMFKMVKHMVSESNSLFRMGKTLDLAKMTEAVQSEILEWLKKEHGDPSAVKEHVAEFIRSFGWNELKPVYAFERLGSESYMQLFWDAIEAEGVWARDMEEAKQFLDAQIEKTGYRKWDMEKAHEFTLPDGKVFKLTLQDMMSIYAYSKREQAYDHMTIGGFQFAEHSEYKDKDGKKRVHLTGDLYRIDLATIQQIIGELEKMHDGNVIKYVDAVQTYLTEMGKKGNEVSRTLYGIDIFNETAYFPLMSSKDFRSSVETTLNGTQTQVSLKNTGMSKETVPHAENPIILQGFDDVVKKHIDTMSKYHAYVLPIENLRRVFDSSTISDDGNEYVSTKNIIKKVFGTSAEKYFDNYITDLNGGTFTKGYNTPAMANFAKFKATAVGASLSVIVQQPFAVVRALDMISPKYLFGNVDKHEEKTLYAEIEKYAPVATIKKMGGFDMGSSRTAMDYLGARTDKGFKRVRDKVNDIAMWGAGKADELGWGIIWKAVKREVASEQKLKPGTAEFFEACGKRFTEIITYTQVYDSVNSRSGMMRSKSDLAKFMTSFMGEPTTVVNMAVNSMLKMQRAKGKTAKREAMRHLGRTIGVLLTSTLLTTIAKSAVYAMRDDDDDEAYLERWAKHTGENLGLWGDLNPMTMLPYARDIVSILEGWDVERPDMTLISNVITSAQRMLTDGTDVNEALTFIGDTCNMFGVPAKNVIRDGKAIINFFGDIFDNIQPTNMGGAFVRGITGEEQSNTDALYDAIMSGDEGKLDVIEDKYKNESSYETAVKKSLRENDPRIREALKIRMTNGITGEYNRILQEIINEGNFEQSIVYEAMKAEYNYFNGKIEEAADLLKDGDREASNDIIRDLKKKYKGTFTQDDILKAVKRRAGLLK